MRTLARGTEFTAEVEVNRSRFLSVVRRVETEDQARMLVAQARRLHHAARHHCSAYIVGTAPAVERANDDGEPAGTAGAPMLEVLRGRELSDVGAVVTRYFGGTLLGAGGLVRAYRDAVADALDKATFVRRERLQLTRLVVDHAQAGAVESSLRAKGVLIRDIEYGEDVSLTLAAGPDLALDQLIARILGRVPQLATVGHTWIDVLAPDDGPDPP